MDLSNRTLEILKNFATINMSLVFNEGTTLKTVSPQKTILAEAKIEETFDRKFGVYDLNELISTISLIDNPKVELEDSGIIIKGDGGVVAKYLYSQLELIVEPDPKKSLPVPDDSTEFALKKDSLKRVIRAAQVLGLPDIIVEGKDGVISLSALDTKSKSSNDFKLSVDNSYEGSDFRAQFRVDNMVLMMVDYKVRIAEQYGYFVSTDDSLTYFIATEAE
jgi:hypothetical protein